MVDDGQSVQMSREVPLCCRTHPATLSNAQCAAFGKAIDNSIIRCDQVTQGSSWYCFSQAGQRPTVAHQPLSSVKSTDHSDSTICILQSYCTSYTGNLRELMKKCAFCGGRQNDEVGFDWTETTPACCQRQSNSWLVAQNLFRGQCVRIILVQMYSLQRKQAVSRCSSSKHPE
ncbi:hypothetical protein T4D_2844 [Trichinella pseudospiralis]|uniref:Uncharacterized protein n=1 Tax=Trichinella pseudospiralis TaxID=6337 RepID=A0A0V1FGF2_TRIPS|nr:hypothetical protein T4D_2844 [Trichinella pseudospiralis]